MPADVSVRRFAGLATHSASVEGEADELIQAENVIFDEGGVVQARPGFHFFSNARAGDQWLRNVGKYEFLTQRLLVSEDTYYLWEGDKDVPNIPLADPISFSAGSRTANVVTLTVPAGHYLAVNDQIHVTAPDTTYNGTFTITSVLTGPDRITYAQTAANDPASGAGTILLSSAINFDVLDNPGAEYAGKLYLSNGKSWNGGFNHNASQPKASWAAMTVHAERMWWISRQDSGARLYFSEPGNPESWPAANFIDVSPSDGWFPTALVSFQNRLYIFKERELYVLDTPGIPTTWTLRRFARIGAHHLSVTEYEGAIYWTSDVGAYRFDGAQVQKLSDPIANVFREGEDRDEDQVFNSFQLSNTVVFRDNWIISLVVHHEARYFCYNVKTNQWSEWSFPASSLEGGGLGRYPLSIWTEDQDSAFIGGFRAGIYMTYSDTNTHGMLVGTEMGDFDYWVDETGTQIGTPSVTEHEYDVVLQTKFADWGDPYGMKRVLDWMIEQEGTDLLVEQIDDRGAVIDKLITGVFRSASIAVSASVRLGSPFYLTDLTVSPGHGVVEGDRIQVDLADATYDGVFLVASATSTSIIHQDFTGADASGGAGTIVKYPRPGTVYQDKVGGFGYFRRLSLKLTASNFRDTGFKLYGLYGRMRQKGRVNRPTEQQV